MSRTKHLCTVLAIISELSLVCSRLSGIVRNKQTPGKSIPGSGGRIGAAPGDNRKSVVGLSLRKTGLKVADFDLLRLTIDRHYLVMRLNIDIEPVAEKLR